MPVALCALAGVLGALQPKINSTLADRLGSPLTATLVNFSAAAVCAGIATGSRRRTRRAFADAPSAGFPRWALLAGLCGAVVVLSGAVAVGTVGVAVFSVAFFAGQVGAGLVVDRAGIGVGGARAVTWPRVAASLLAVAAVALAQVGRPVGELAPLIVLFVVAAGGTSAFQAACNGRISHAVGDPLMATALNTGVGLAALSGLVGMLALTGSVSVVRWPVEPWLYLGGVLGFVIVLSITVGAATIGVLRTTVVMLGAQLLAAVALDTAADGRPPPLGVVAGGVLVVAAVAIVGVTRTSRAIGRANPEPAAAPGPPA